MWSPGSFARRSTAWRALYTCFTIVILFYVLFDVLDLDCSNCVKVFNAARPTKPETFTATEPELDVSHTRFVPLSAGAQLLAPGSDKSALRRNPDTVQISLLHRVQDHGYRLGLARSSLPEKSPYD